MLADARDGFALDPSPSEQAAARDRQLFISRWPNRGQAAHLVQPTCFRHILIHGASGEGMVGESPARFQLFRVNDDGMEWRFVASNNQVVAVGVDGIADVAAARARLGALQSTLPDARLAYYRDPTGRWRWDLRVAGAVLATSSRWYHSRVVCEATLGQFLQDAPAASVVDSVRRPRGVIDLRAAGVERPLAARLLMSGRRLLGRP